MKVLKINSEDIEGDHIHLDHYPFVLREGEFIKLPSNYYIQRKTKTDRLLDSRLNWWSWYNIKRYINRLYILLLYYFNNDLYVETMSERFKKLLK